MIDADKKPISKSLAEKWGGADKLLPLDVKNGRIIGKIPIKRIGRNPFKRSPWIDGQDVTRNNVQEALKNGEFENSPYPGYLYSTKSDWDKQRHERRIAYLVKNKNDAPISIEFKDAENDILEIDDGWHRLGAAIIRKDTHIQIEVGGYFHHTVSRLGAICSDYCFIH